MCATIVKVAGKRYTEYPGRAIELKPFLEAQMKTDQIILSFLEKYELAEKLTQAKVFPLEIRLSEGAGPYEEMKMILQNPGLDLNGKLRVLFQEIAFFAGASKHEIENHCLEFSHAGEGGELQKVEVSPEVCIKKYLQLLFHTKSFLFFKRQPGDQKEIEQTEGNVEKIKI